MAENEQETDPVAQRVQEIIQRVRNIRRPFKEHRQAIINGILRGMEARSYERRRGSRYNLGPEEDEVQKLKAELETLKADLENLRKRPKSTVAIRGE